ncbi:MAG: hypothetical protein ACK55I_48700, partial [bacterium]
LAVRLDLVENLTGLDAGSAKHQADCGGQQGTKLHRRDSLSIVFLDPRTATVPTDKRARGRSGW